MLVAFSVENFTSFKERATLSMVAADLRSKPPELDSTNVFLARDELALLTSAAIYGANASGKSNLIAAIRFMRNFILNSSRETRLHQPIQITPYLLSSETERASSRFEIVFVQQQVVYRYGFCVSRERVEEEWLYATANKKETYLFERNLDTIRVNRRMFKEGQGLEERTRPNALFLSVATQWNGERAGQITEWFEQLTINYGISDDLSQRLSIKQYPSDVLPPEVIAFVRELDLGIEDMRLENPSEEVPFRMNEGKIYINFRTPTIRTVHTKYDSNGEPIAAELFDLSTQESQGTQRLFVLAEPILTALRTGTVLVVDELDARLHPILTAAIIRLFNSPETNPNHAQLIFTTHDTNLLGDDLFRRDQVWFVEKSRRGESTLYSLVEYKVRNDAAYEKNYIAGRYGAIPYLGSLAAVIGADDAEQEALTALNDSELPSEVNGYEE